jgi:hypothetical protein
MPGLTGNRYAHGDLSSLPPRGRGQCHPRDEDHPRPSHKVIVVAKSASRPGFRRCFIPGERRRHSRRPHTRIPFTHTRTTVARTLAQVLIRGILALSPAARLCGQARSATAPMPSFLLSSPPGRDQRFFKETAAISCFALPVAPVQRIAEASGMAAAFVRPCGRVPDYPPKWRAQRSCCPGEQTGCSLTLCVMGVPCEPCGGTSIPPHGGSHMPSRRISSPMRRCPPGPTAPCAGADGWGAR